MIRNVVLKVAGKDKSATRCTKIDPVPGSTGAVVEREQGRGERARLPERCNGE